MPDSIAARVQHHVLNERRSTFGTVRPIKLANGRTISVQASASHYSEPRDSQGPWTAFEVGTHWDHPLLAPHFGSQDECGPEGLRVFPWVPAAVVIQVIEDNGGFA